MNLPNKLTVTRVLLVPLLLFIYMFPYDMIHVEIPIYNILNAQISLINLIVLAIFFIASLTDYFDGRIARKEKLITTFGKFADPIADKLLVNTILLLLASDQTISIIIPIIMISRDTIVDAIRLVAANKQIVMAASPLGKVKTVLQMMAVALVLINNFPFSYLGLPVDQILLWAATGVSIISGLNYFMKSRAMLTESM